MICFPQKVCHFEDGDNRDLSLRIKESPWEVLYFIQQVSFLIIIFEYFLTFEQKNITKVVDETTYIKMAKYFYPKLKYFVLTIKTVDTITYMNACSYIQQ